MTATEWWETVVYIAQALTAFLLGLTLVALLGLVVIGVACLPIPLVEAWRRRSRR